jgi:hypothetical protein
MTLLGTKVGLKLKLAIGIVELFEHQSMTCPLKFERPLRMFKDISILNKS